MGLEGGSEEWGNTVVWERFSQTLGSELCHSIPDTWCCSKENNELFSMGLERSRVSSTQRDQTRAATVDFFNS